MASLIVDVLASQPEVSMMESCPHLTTVKSLLLQCWRSVSWELGETKSCVLVKAMSPVYLSLLFPYTEWASCLDTWWKRQAENTFDALFPLSDHTPSQCQTVYMTRRMQSTVG